MNYRPVHIVAVACACAAGYLYATDQLKGQTALILFVGSVLLLLWIDTWDKFITLKEAKIISMREAREMQDKDEIEKGELSFMNEEALKYLIGLSPSGEVSTNPDHFDIGIEIRGTPTIHRLFKISMTGNFIGQTLIDKPSKFHATEQKEEDFKVVGAEFGHQRADIALRKKEEEKKGVKET